MRPISARVRKIIDADPFYRKCARAGMDCRGRLTMEHVWIYAGRQIDEAWSILPLCYFHHLGAGLDKRVNEEISLRRATEADLARYPKKDWKALQRRFKT